MKKYPALLFTMAILLAASGCSGKPPAEVTEDTQPPDLIETAEPQAPEATPEPTPEPENTTLAIGDQCVLGDFEVILNSYEITDRISDNDYMGFTPDEGSQYVAVNLTVKNTGTKASNFMESFSIGDSITAKIMYQGKYEYSASNLMGFSDDLHNAFLNPLESKTGIIAFSVIDEAAQSGELTFDISYGSETYTYTLVG